MNAINNIQFVLKSLWKSVLFEVHIKYKISLMSVEGQIEINEYSLTIFSVKMKVKFPCKMKLEHSGNALTDQVQSKEHGKFLFNQEVTIQQSAQQASLDFNIILATEKGSKYVSGLIKLATCDLQKAEGQKIIAPLSKCLDQEAYCELKINKVKIGKAAKRISVSSTLLELKKLGHNEFNSKNSAKEQMDLPSPRNKKISGVETRSEIGFGGLGLKNGHQWQDTRSKGAAQTLIYKSSFLRSPNAKKTMAMLSPKSRLGPDLNQEYEQSSQRQKLSNVDSEVYREGYQKLKQKYKAQTQSLSCEISKRQQLQANQNNYKVQIMRLKLKAEEQERIITQKNEKINQLQLVISQINKQDLDNTFLKEENKNLEEKISMLNDTINSLKKQTQNIKTLYEQNQRNDKKLIEQLRTQLEGSKQKLQLYSVQTGETIRQKTQQIISLTNEIKSKVQQLQLQKSEIYKLQAHGQTKVYQFQQTLQQQKNSGAQLANQLGQKIEGLEREKKELEKEMAEVKGDKEKMKGLILKAQYDKRVLQQEVRTVKGELVELKGVKEEKMNLARELGMLEQDNRHLRRQLQTQAESKEINLQEINAQYELNLNYYKKEARQYEDRHKTIASSKIQLEAQLDAAHSLGDKLKRQLETATTQLAALKTTLKQNRHYAHELEQKKLSLENQLVIAQNKLRFGQHTYKAEAQKQRSSLERCRNELAAENAKVVQLFESKSNIEMELNKTRIQLQYNEDKIEKLFSSNKELQTSLEYQVRQHQAHSQELSQQATKLQQELKIAHQTIHQSELSLLADHQKVETLRKQLKLSEDKVAFLENQLKLRNQDLAQQELKIKSLRDCLSSIEQEHSALKHQHTVLQNEQRKLQKISELKTEQLAQLKAECHKLEQQKQSSEKTELQLREQLKKGHEKYLKLDIKLRAADREFNKFKELMLKTIRTEYAKLPLLTRTQQKQPHTLIGKKEPEVTDSRETVVVNSSAKQIQTSPEQGKVQSLSGSGILSQLSQSITDSKTTLLKLIEHNKQLKKEIASVREQSEQCSHKYQFTEIELHREIQLIEEELQQVYSQKKEEIVNYDYLLSELNGKLHDKQNLCEQLTQRIEELQLALSYLNLDFEKNNTQNGKKVELLEKSIRDLEDKVEVYRVSLSNQEDRNHELEEKLWMLKTERQHHNEHAAKLKIVLQQTSRLKQGLETSLEELAKERKSLLGQLNETQLQLNEQTQLKTKGDELLAKEENKTLELKEFVTALMKQKENVIRSELEKSDRILELETLQIELNRDLELYAEETQRLKSELEQLREKHRAESTKAKQLQTDLSEWQTKCRKLSEKLEEKEKELQMKEEVIGTLDRKYRQLNQKNYKESLDLHSQIDSKYSENISLTRELNLKIEMLEAKLEELEHTRAKHHHDCLILNDELLAEKEHSALLKSQHQKLEIQLEETQEECRSLENRNSQLALEIETREEQVTQLNEKVVLRENQIQALHRDKLLHIESLTLECSLKLNSLQEEQRHKLQLVENERELLRSQLEEKINELELSLTQNFDSSLKLSDIKLNYEARLKQIETERLNFTRTKNYEIKKLTDQSQLLFQKTQQLESAQKQNSELVQNLRKRLLQEQKVKKQIQEKHKSSHKLQQAQLNALKSKQSKLSQQLQSVYQGLWSNQRQVRKVAQNYLKKVLDQCDNLHIDKITNSSKGLQAELVKAMTLNLSPLP